MRQQLSDNVTLYLGDCRDILPTLGKVDAVVTDPPYGIGINKSQRLSVSRGHGGETWDDQPIDHERLSLTLAAAESQIIWGGNYFNLPPTRCFLIWDKNNAGRDFADCELAWTNIDAVARRIIFRPMNMDGGKLHPTQKPIDVIGWCIQQLPPPAETILDPFMGSGTTGVAAVSLDRKFIGIEIEPKYFDIACRRISDELKRPRLPLEAPQKQTQEALPI